jgi:hypothetical protein
MDTRTGEIFEPSEPMDREKRRRMERAQARGELVPVSEQVARQQIIGQRVEDRRRKRKAAKAARRSNRRKVK